jgi:hypothetical protein
MNTSKKLLPLITRLLAILVLIIVIFVSSTCRIQISFINISSNVNKTYSLNNACLTDIAQYNCNQNFISVINDVNKPKIISHSLKSAISRMPKKSELALTCKPNQQSLATYNYNKVWLSSLAKTNSVADNQREEALVNGESYQIFLSQLSSIFSSYNSQVTQEYTSYITNLGGCSPTVKSPTLFQTDS